MNLHDIPREIEVIPREVLEGFAALRTQYPSYDKLKWVPNKNGGAAYIRSSAYVVSDNWIFLETNYWLDNYRERVSNMDEAVRTVLKENVVTNESA